VWSYVNSRRWPLVANNVKEGRRSGSERRGGTTQVGLSGNGGWAGIAWAASDRS
jgi:hypothetical protein